MAAILAVCHNRHSPTGRDNMEPTTDLLTDVAATLEQVGTMAVADGEVADLGERLKALTIIGNSVKELTDAIKAQLADIMPPDEIPLQGSGVLRKAYRNRDTWRDEGAKDQFNHDLAVSVANAMGRDEFTGEIDDARRRAALDAAKLVIDSVYQITKLKAAGARQLSIDMEDYRIIEKVPTVVVDLEGTPDE